MAFDPETATLAEPKAFDPNTATPVKDITPAGAAGVDLRKTGKRVGDFASQRDEGIDYFKGVDQALFRAGFSRMSNDEEKTSWLEKQVGAGNFGKDSFGAWYIQPEGLKKLGIKSNVPISVDEQRVTNYDVADWAGDVPAIVGGAGMALAASGVGALPGMALAALGAAGGKAYDEILKILQGHNKKGPAEMAGTLALEGAGAAAGEGIFRAGARVLKGYGPGNSPERIQLTKEAMDAGLTPKTYQFLDSGGPLLKRFQAAGEKVLGDPVQGKNRETLLKMQDGLLERAGAPTEDIGTKLIDKVKTKVDRDTLQVDYLKNRANDVLDKSLKDIQAQLGSKDPNVGATVAETIRGARTKFGDAAAELYSKVDEMAGVPFVPTASLKAQAEKIAGQLPRTEEGRVIFTKSGEANPIEDILSLPENITITQAQRIRTMLAEGSLTRDLTSGVDKRDLAMLKKASEGMFDDAANSLGYTVRSSMVDESGKPLTTAVATGDKAAQAVAALRAADEFYKNGIRKFDFPTIAAITRDAKMSGAVDPERVINYVIKPGHTSDVARVKGLVPDPVWQKVQREHFDGLVADSTSLINGESTIVGKRLYDKINNMGKTFDAVYGKQAPEIRQYAKELAARDGKIDPNLLSKDTNVSNGLAADLSELVAKQKELDTFMKDNYLAALSRPGQEAEQAVDFIFRPKSSQRILEAKKFYGENSPEFQGLQNGAMQKILSSFVEATDDPLVKVLNGAQLRTAMDRYGPQTLEATFGKDLTKDLYKFADIAEFVTKKGPMGAGGIVAANVALHPVKNIGKIADFFVTGRLLRSPGVIKWLMEGINPDTPTKKAAAALARVSSLATALVGDETGSATVNLPVDPVEETP